jgi:sialate O-acetylesterase
VSKRLSCFVASLLVVMGVFEVRADVTLPKVLSNHMVLQRDRPLPIWGWADPDEQVTVQLDDATATAKADAQGNWKVMLPAVKADGKAHTLTVAGKNKIELADILIGDVWIGSGQSNMEFSVAGSIGGKEAIAAADCPQLRLLHVEKVQASQPAKDIVVFTGARRVKDQPPPPPATGPAWKVCSPQTVPNFSAVLYYFGQRLHKEINVPVGLINSSWGGSGIEPWTVSGEKGGGMYNAMIAPLKPFAICGAIWYQGESNVGNGFAYADKMKALIEGWRKAWDCDFPFYFVQIAPFSGYKTNLSPLWEAQVASLKIPGTGMAVTTDLVENIKDIHPRQKFEVGNRLALWALAKDYGKQDLVYSGPLYKSMKVEGSKIRLSFAHVGGGLKSRDGKPLAEFEVAGADDKFIPAEATIDGATVVVQAQEVTAPTQARFGWRNEANPNLINAEGLPASPFQSNNWQGGTGE